MQTRFEKILKSFFKNVKVSKQLRKDFYIQADDIRFYTQFKKQKNDLHISVELFGWSNKHQKNTPILLSSWANDLDDGKQLEPLIQKYAPLAKKFLNYLVSLKYFWQFKELFYQFENPTIIYHYKLLNTFTQEEIKKITKLLRIQSPILNTSYLLENHTRYTYGELFMSHYFTGCYFCGGGVCSVGVEISVDLDESDFAIIETDERQITKEELFEKYMSYTSTSHNGTNKIA